MLINIIFFIMFLTSGCSYNKRINTQKELSKIKDTTKTMLDSDILVQESANHFCPVLMLKDKIETGISVDEAIQLALFNNLDLQADFEELGIAKSELVQAGLYKNPSLSSQFKFPANNNTMYTKIETNLIFSVADLWHLGARKKVAYDQLEIVSLRIGQTVLDTYTQTKKAFIQSLSASELHQNALETLEYAQAWRDRIHYRQQFGFTSDLDINLADANVDRQNLEVIHYKREVNNAITNLRYLLGLLPSTVPVSLTDEFVTDINLPVVAALEQNALNDRPEIQILKMKIQQSEDILALEKRRVIKEADIGFAFERDFEGSKGKGFSIGIDIPIFDTNYAQIDRAHVLIQKTRKQLRAQKNLVRKELIQAYENVQAAQEEIKTYQPIIQLYEKAISYTATYVESMQFDPYIGLKTQIDYYEAKKMKITSLYKLAYALVDLERATGKKLEVIHNQGDFHESNA